MFDKRGHLRNAFRGFDPEAVAAAMTADDVERLMLDASIIRNRRKIEATVHNARLLSTCSLSRLSWQHQPRQRHRITSWADGRMTSRIPSGCQWRCGSGISDGRASRRAFVPCRPRASRTVTSKVASEPRPRLIAAGQRSQDQPASQLNFVLGLVGVDPAVEAGLQDAVPGVLDQAHQ